MVFSSLTFLQCFLPLCLLAYFLVPQKWRNGTLFLFSLLFYAWGEPVYVVLMLFSTALDYTCGQMAERHRGQRGAKIALLVSLCVNLGMLGVFKYSDFLIGTVNSLFGTALPQPNLPLPIGISFYTFQTMSYTIDVYRGEAKAQKNIINFGAYVTLFPQLIAGPIVRYQTVADELEHRDCTADLFAEGVKRFACGIGKKVLLANNIGLLWEAASAQAAPTVLTAWLGVIAYGFQIYFDFSGYSDMAIGLGRMLGFRFLENFNYPFLADSITDFWRRWHISMGTWFRDYVYIPLGGNKGGLAKQLRNIAIVWLLTGFWHGASWNFVLWGVYFGILLVLEKLFLLRCLKRLPAVLRHLYALTLITISWTLFAFTEISEGAAWCKAMFSGVPFDSGSLYLLLTYGPMLAICALAATPLGKRFYEKLGTRLGQRALTVVDCSGLACVLVMAAAYLVSGSYAETTFPNISPLSAPQRHGNDAVLHSAVPRDAALCLLRRRWAGGAGRQPRLCGGCAEHRCLSVLRHRHRAAAGHVDRAGAAAPALCRKAGAAGAADDPLRRRGGDLAGADPVGELVGTDPAVGLEGHRRQCRAVYRRP